MAKADKNDSHKQDNTRKLPQPNTSHAPASGNVVDSGAKEIITETGEAEGTKPRVLVPTEPTALPDGHKPTPPEKNLDPDNDKKMRENDAKSKSIVDPIRVVKRVHETPTKDAPPANPVIKGISGKTLTLVGGRYKDGEEATVFIAGKAQVILNGKETTLSELDNGDSIILGNGGRNHLTNAFEYRSIIATRKAK